MGPPDHAEAPGAEAPLQAVAASTSTRRARRGRARVRASNRACARRREGVVVSGVLIWVLSSVQWRLPCPRRRRDKRTTDRRSYSPPGARSDSVLLRRTGPASSPRPTWAPQPPGGSIDRPPDPHGTAGIAVGAGVLVLVLLVFGVRGCLDSRKERAFKDYVRDVARSCRSPTRRASPLRAAHEPGWRATWTSRTSSTRSETRRASSWTAPGHRPPRRARRAPSATCRDARVPARRRQPDRQELRTRSPPRATGAAAPRRSPRACRTS